MIVVDLDGTCLDGTGRVTALTRATLEAVLKTGRLLVPASGRGMSDIIRLIGLRGICYVVSANGAVVHDVARGVRLSAHLISAELAAQVVRTFWRRDVLLYVHEDDEDSTHLWGCACPGDIAGIFGTQLGNLTLQADLAGAVEAGTPHVAKIGLRLGDSHAPGAVAEELRARFAGLNVFQVDERSIEVTAEGATKGEGVSRVMLETGVGATEVCAIGDGGNDISMFEVAGLSIAMPHAAESVRAAADHVAAFDNGHDGVAAILAEISDVRSFMDAARFGEAGERGHGRGSR